MIIVKQKNIIKKQNKAQPIAPKHPPKQKETVKLPISSVDDWNLSNFASQERVSCFLLFSITNQDLEMDISEEDWPCHLLIDGVNRTKEIRLYSAHQIIWNSFSRNLITITIFLFSRVKLTNTESDFALRTRNTSSVHVCEGVRGDLQTNFPRWCPMPPFVPSPGAIMSHHRCMSIT